MNLSLDPTSEQRIQREIDRGHYREPAEVVAHALALLEDQEDWLLRDKDAINQRLDESCAQIQRGEGTPGDEARNALDKAFGLWADRKEDGLAYQDRMRDEW